MELYCASGLQHVSFIPIIKVQRNEMKKQMTLLILLHMCMRKEWQCSRIPVAERSLASSNVIESKKGKRSNLSLFLHLEMRQRVANVSSETAIKENPWWNANFISFSLIPLVTFHKLCPMNEKGKSKSLNKLSLTFD